MYKNGCVLLRIQPFLNFYCYSPTTSVMKYLLALFLSILSFIIFAQQTAIITYSFNEDLSATVDVPDIVNPDLVVLGGQKLAYKGLVNDGGNLVAKSTISNNNATNYTFTFVRCDIRPMWGYVIKIDEIKIRHRSLKTGNNYVFRIGASTNGLIPVNTNSLESTANLPLPASYSENVFTPGNQVAVAGGDNYVSAFITPRGAYTSNDIFDWHIDQIEIKLSYSKLLNVPEFRLDYSFDQQNTSPVIYGSSTILASDMTARAAAEGITAGGKYWIKLNANSNVISFNDFGLLFDITPHTGYEVMMKNYEIVHAGSGVPNESRVNRIGLYRDISRASAGVEVGRDDFAAYTGRAVYGDAVPSTVFKTSLITDEFILNSKHYFTISVNRHWTPNLEEYWTVDNVRINGWVIPAGRENLLRIILEGGDLLLNAKKGDEAGSYTEEKYNDFNQLLSNALVSLMNLSLTNAEIDSVTAVVQDAVSKFPGQMNSGALTVHVNTNAGISLTEGFAGFNMRIADGPWTYTNPSFKEGVKKMSPGFLRYFSGTSGDYFDLHTGQYVLQWFEGMSKNYNQEGEDSSNDDFKSIPDLYKWMEGKGAHRFMDYARLCGEVGAKVVVTWNGFFDSSRKVAQFARFCKNNNIVVDYWQFTNEPNAFPYPNYGFWNDGEDYMHKTKEIADSILSVFPDANLSAFYGAWPKSVFPAKIKEYQDQNNRFWDYVSFHAYPTRRDEDVLFNDGYLTANHELQNSTGTDYFNSITDVTWPNAKMLMTEFGVWNNSLNNTNYSAIYVSEYFMRMSNHPQAWMIGKHHISSAVSPLNNFQTEIMQAYQNKIPLNTDLLNTGFRITTEGYGHYIVNKALNNSSFSWQTTHDNTDVVPKRFSGSIPAIYASAYKGVNDKDFLLITNKTGNVYDLNILIDGSLLTRKAIIEYFTETDPSKPVTTVLLDSMPANEIKVPPYSVMRVEWLKDVTAIPAPLAPRIYAVDHGAGSVRLKWWKRSTAESYRIRYGTSPGVYTATADVTVPEAEINGLQSGQTYYFSVTASNTSGTSQPSNEVSTRVELPSQPKINFVYAESERITIHWESVPFANGYRVKYGTTPGIYTHIMDAGNVTGFIMRNMQNNTPYYISVAAFNRSGEGEDAPEVTARPVVNRPWPPYLVFAKESVDGTVDVSWTPSDSTHNAVFEVYYCPTPWDESRYELVAANVSGNQLKDFTPRLKGYHYYRVKSRNVVGESVYFSNIATVDKLQDGNTGMNTGFQPTVVIYPNPAGDKLFVKNSNSNIPIFYKVYNAIGKLMKEGIGSEINIAGCETGMLIVEVYDGMDNFRGIVMKN